MLLALIICLRNFTSEREDGTYANIAFLAMLKTAQ
jgi:hypothetical protein